MKRLKVYAYTKGTGSGHLTRINAVYKGFKRARIACDFYVSAHRSKYLEFLEPGIKLCKKGEFPRGVDIFICDWRSDSFVDSLPKRLAKTWIGLRRLGTMKVTFPSYFHVIAIEPGVKGDATIWPVISTWPDELVTRSRLRKIVGTRAKKKIALLCENGAYPKHVDRVFDKKIPKAYLRVKISNSPFAEGKRDLSYYPAARLFKAADYHVIGGGYNSLHEALSYADKSKISIINVGGDDQALRIKKSAQWERGRGSQAHVLAQYIVGLHRSNKRIN